MFYSYQVRNFSSVVALIGGILLLMRGLTDPFILFVGLVYLIGAIISFIAFKKLDRFCCVMVVISFFLFEGVFFAPLWAAGFFIQTPEGHLHLAERYVNRGQIFGNRDQVLKHYLLAAQCGNVEAQFRLGEAYFFGHYGQTRSRVEAIKWFKAAADQGNPNAIRTLKTIESSN